MQWGPALCRALCVPFSTGDPTMKHLQSITLLLMFLSTPAYAEQVQATWYGNELRGHRTASGEIFNPSGMTAAHRSLPFGTCLVIGNPRTGRKVAVRVNDRGPSRQALCWTFHLARQRPLACDRHKA